MSANGWGTNDKALGNSTGQMALCTRVVGTTTLQMDTDVLYTRMGTTTKVTGRMGMLMERETSFTWMRRVTQEIG